MFTKLLLVAAALGAATPALAQTADFTGPRVEVSANLPDFDRDDVTIGTTLGYDVAVLPRTTLGVDVTAEDLFKNNGRQLGAGARVGYALTPNLQAFARAGYSNLDLRHTNLDGYTLGGGLNLGLTKNLYTGVEYRYTNYEHLRGSHGARVALGLRF